MSACKRCSCQKEETSFYRKGKTCKDCLKAMVRERYATDPEYRERKKRVASQYHAKNRDEIVKRRREKYRATADVVRAARIAAYQENPETAKEAAARWRRANKERVRGYNTLRKKQVARRTPPWVDREAILAIYEECPEGMHVDHIVPLNGVTVEGHRVSGLHVPWNLRHLPARENISRRNIMAPDDVIIGIAAA